MILVAGGTGQLGRRVVQRLVDGGEQVRVLTRDLERATNLPTGVQTVVGDVRRGPLVQIVDGCSAVISAVHGFTGPTRTSPEAVDRTGNASLMAAAKQVGVGRFVLVSVVGAAPDRPMSLHRMKYAAEQELHSSGLSGSTVRSTPFLETWLGIIGAKLANGGPALVFGPGQNPINFVSADDVAAFVCLAVGGDERVGDQVSVGGPQNLTFTEIAEELLAHTSHGKGTKHVPLAALRAMSLVARPIKPSLARQARAAVVMNTTDMAFDASPVRDRFPDIPTTTMARLAEASTSPGLRP
ncbi:MAG: SDR family oxidoreductase [Actinomycetota bacterium]|nr:SDR family oxidoreductase [Actinomycetota bacterium]